MAFVNVLSVTIIPRLAHNISIMISLSIMLPGNVQNMDSNRADNDVSGMASGEDAM